MKVLLGAFDLYSSVGGGETVYRQIIKKRPNDTFYYFTQRELLADSRPANAIPIPYKILYSHNQKNLPKEQKHLYHVYVQTQNMAASVERCLGKIELDVFDTPDYQQYGLFMRQSLAQHGITVDVIALAMHGVMSSTMRANWPDATLLSERVIAKTYLRERLQYRTADVRYAISPMYIHRSRYGNLPVNFLDPLCLLDEITPVKTHATADELPNICFIGRREKCKGPDLFADLVWWVPRDRYNQALLIGPDGMTYNGISSEEILKRTMRLRDTEMTIVSHFKTPDLYKLYSERNLMAVTSRLDQFNLVALEAILHGCPVVISDKAGIVSYLKQYHPEIAVNIINLDCARTAALTISELLANYDSYRDQLVESLARSPMKADYATLDKMYENKNVNELKARKIMSDLTTRFLLFNQPVLRKINARRVLGWLKNQISNKQVVRFKKLYRAYRNKTLMPMFKEHYKRQLNKLGIDARLAMQIFYSKKSPISNRILQSSESSAVDRQKKISAFNSVVNHCFVNRMRLHSELIRLERKCQNDLVAAAYSLRLMRWCGKDYFNDLPIVVDTLTRRGFHQEARVAQIMYGSKQPHEEGLAYLDEVYHRHLRAPKTNAVFEIHDDRRQAVTPTVSVIVSLYNSADKFRTFVQMIRQQTLMKQGAIEVILVDSGSPTDEYSIFKQEMTSQPFPGLYVRTDIRETIQTAWNHGIALAHGRYLAFLGADEGVHPQAFEVLAKELDAHADIDWVMADSVVTEVNRQGVFDYDVMEYDRSGYQQTVGYLDCSYLSYVGGLYRKSIHERFGYYDVTFRGAGDTEFKNRILPFIKSKHIPMALGVFNNYPQARTTQSCLAEIEDLRAWYLHRSSSGVEYALSSMNDSYALELLKRAVSYRKSYCTHISTDFDLAYQVSQFLYRRSPNEFHQSLVNDFEKIIQECRHLELPMGRKSSVINLFKAKKALNQISKKHMDKLGLNQKPRYAIFNDNRYEQHFWGWS